MSDSLKIKICGVKTLEVVQIAADTGADLVGFNFYPPSPRYLPYEAADLIVHQTRTLPTVPKIVGLFVNIQLSQVLEVAERLQLDYIQLAGSENEEYVSAVAACFPVLKVVRLVPKVTVNQALAIIAPFSILPNVTLMLDTSKAGFFGGTGEVGNWQVARQVCARFPTLLAGGLTPENVAQAIEQVAPWGVDVASGVESNVGEKDPLKVARFCHSAKAAIVKR